MRRITRMAIYLIVATLLSTQLPINFIVAGIAMLAMEDLHLSDAVIISIASISLDHLGPLPLGASILPLLLIMVILHVLRSHIFLHSFFSRFLWATLAIAGFYGMQGIVLMLRGGGTVYLWNAFLWGTAHALAEGFCAALMAPYFHRYLTITWSELRRPQSIVV